MPHVENAGFARGRQDDGVFISIATSLDLLGSPQQFDKDLEMPPLEAARLLPEVRVRLEHGL